MADIILSMVLDFNVGVVTAVTAAAAAVFDGVPPLSSFVVVVVSAAAAAVVFVGVPALPCLIMAALDMAFRINDVLASEFPDVDIEVLVVTFVVAAEDDDCRFFFFDSCYWICCVFGAAAFWTISTICYPGNCY